MRRKGPWTWLLMFYLLYACFLRRRVNDAFRYVSLRRGVKTRRLATIRAPIVKRPPFRYGKIVRKGRVWVLNICGLGTISRVLWWQFRKKDLNWHFLYLFTKNDLTQNNKPQFQPISIHLKDKSISFSVVIFPKGS